MGLRLMEEVVIVVGGAGALGTAVIKEASKVSIFTENIS